ncbi:hypothetical protein PG994_002013 [Apiospora phragmitis]|uniref:Uncharacterized protein n=1 Tax=Apiospora phragmitis TaxID=2905665 RepID=A0ABR1WV36_9PEZI
MATQTHIGAASSPIARHILQDVSRKTIPGCSAAEHEHDGGRPLLISNTMLQAYNKMRGPAAKDSQEDPLFEWIHLCEDISSRDGNQAPSRSKRDILHMLRKVDETLSEGNAAGDSPREAVFEINRPEQADHHIRAPPRHDFSTHLLTACCADFEFDSEDSDDEESSVPHGRISPALSLLGPKVASAGAETRSKCLSTRTNRGAVPDPRSGRHAPHAAAALPLPRLGRRAAGRRVHGLRPVALLRRAHEPIPAVRGRGRRRRPQPGPDRLRGRYSRMDPLAGKSLRKLMFYHRPNAPSGGGTPNASPTIADAGVDEYGQSEIEAILNSPSARPPHTQYSGLPTTPSHLDHHLSQAYAVIAVNEAQAECITPLLRHQTAQIRNLQEEREHLSAAVGIVQSRRRRRRQHQEEAAQRQQQQQRSPEAEQREKRIRQHVAAHLEDVQFQYVRAADTLGHERMRKEANDAAIARLERDIAELCHKAGLGSPAEVYDELTGSSPDSANDAAEEYPATGHQQNTVDNSKDHHGNDQEGGGHAGGGDRNNTEGNIFPPLSPLLISTTRAYRQPIITTVTPRNKSAQTPRQHPSPSPSPLIKAGALSPSHHHHQHPSHHWVGELEDDPLPRLKSQYLEMMTPKNGNDKRPDIIGYSHHHAIFDNNSLNIYNNGYDTDVSPTDLYDAYAEWEEEYHNDAEYQATEKILEKTEAYIERLQQH